MSFLSSCCRSRRPRFEDEEALLHEDNDETAFQRRFHKKLHTYQMIVALWQGYMPSTEQLIINMRVLLASDLMNCNNPDLSDYGQQTVRLCRQWLSGLIELFGNKNDKDQIQDVIWYLTRARVSEDGTTLVNQLQQRSVKTDAVDTLESLKSIWSLMMANSDFRLFLEDIGLLGRQIFAESTQSIATVAENTSRKIRPSESEMNALQSVGADKGPPPSVEDLQKESKVAANVVSDSLSSVVEGVGKSIEENTSVSVKETLANRLKQCTARLRQRPDYTNSVTTIGTLLKHYAAAYSRVAENAVDLTENECRNNQAINMAMRNFWSLLSSFGDREEWLRLERSFHEAFHHSQVHSEFDSLIKDVGAFLESMLLEPDFFDHVNEGLDRMRAKSALLDEDKDSLKYDVQNLLQQLRLTLQSAVRDEDLQKFTRISDRLVATVFSRGSLVRPEIFEDSLRVFIPMLLQAIQHVPLPRLEVATPEIDILLESLVFEPGRTVNKSSFLPFRLRLEAQNSVEISKARFRSHSSLTSLMTVKMDGLTVRAEEFGYWMHVHSGLSRLTDEGIASFTMDQRGMDIHINVEIGRDRAESILTLRDVHVRIHHLNYTLRKSRFSWLAWIMKPFIRPILRKVMEREISNSISQFLHAANRELLYARERLRAARIADPESIGTLVKAILARLTPEQKPDIYTSLGIRPSGNEIFRERYAPGSVVRLWEEEGRRATERTQDFEIKGWRNEIFDVHVSPSS